MVGGEDRRQERNEEDSKVPGQIVRLVTDIAQEQELGQSGDQVFCLHVESEMSLRCQHKVK